MILQKSLGALSRYITQEDQFSSRDNLSSVTLRSYTMRRLSNPFGRKVITKTLDTLLQQLLVCMHHPKISDRVTVAATSRDDI